jgi:hypothetical protein
MQDYSQKNGACKTGFLAPMFTVNNTVSYDMQEEKQTNQQILYTNHKPSVKLNVLVNKI